MTPDEQAHANRVLNLIRKVDLERASLKQWAIIKLLTWQPLAREIRFTRCHCRSELMMSYRLPDEARWDARQQEGWESAGFYCPSCKFSNGGAREIERRK